MAVQGPLYGWLGDLSRLEGALEEPGAQWDAVGSATSRGLAAGFWALSNDESTVHLRVRLTDDPASTVTDKWNSFAFHTLIESDGDTSDGSWDHWIELHGIDDQVLIQSNDIVNLAPKGTWCDDVADTTSHCYPATVDNIGLERFPGYARVTPACSALGYKDPEDPAGTCPSGEPCCDSATCMADVNMDGLWDGGGGCTDQFLEVQVPAADLLSATGLAEPDFSINPLVLGISSTGNSVNKDVLGGSCSHSWDYMARGNRDADGDTVLDRDENTFGTDSLDPDSDDDSLSDGEELYGPDLVPGSGDEEGLDPLDPDTDDDGDCDGPREDSYTGFWWDLPPQLEGDKDGNGDVLDPTDDCVTLLEYLNGFE